MFRLQLNVAILVIVHVHKDEAGDTVGSEVNDVFGSPSARPIHDQRASRYVQSEDIPVVIGIVLVGNDLDGEARWRACCGECGYSTLTIV